MNIKKAISLAGGTHQSLADVFARGGAKTTVSRQAVDKWVRARAIPPLRLYQLRELQPGWFERK